MKQIQMLNVPLIDVQKIYEYNIPAYTETTDSIKVLTSLSFNNTQEHGIGMPLPAGTIRIYKEDIDKQLQFIGEDSIDHTPRNENVSLQVGNAFDIVGKTTLLNSTEPGTFSKISIKSYDVSLRNHKTDEDATIKVNVNGLQYDWRIENNSAPFKQKDASTVQFIINVPKASAKDLKFTVVTLYPD
jgi:hypothetical protein